VMMPLRDPTNGDVERRCESKEAIPGPTERKPLGRVTAHNQGQCRKSGDTVKSLTD